MRVRGGGTIGALLVVAVVGALLAGLIAGPGTSGAAVTIVRHPLPVVDRSAQPADITQGWDGNLWLTYSDRPDIGRMTPAGVVTDFPIPTADAGAGGIAAGYDDGATWFTEPTGNKIGRITTSGVVTESPLPETDSEPQSIVAEFDSSLWFTEANARRIGRISEDGAITEYPIPGSGRGADDIVVGSDVALWFTDPANGRVGRISPTGVVSYVSIPGTGPGEASPGSIASGPDGALWVADGQGTIDRVTTSGTVPEFSDPAAAGAQVVVFPEGTRVVPGSGETIARSAPTS